MTMGIQGAKPLSGKVAVVTGATRGAGRGIAVELGAAGAIVYCTGRTIRGKVSPSSRPETIEETAELVNAAGGVGLWAQVDHTIPEQVEGFFARVKAEQDGRLDILVNDVWGGDELTEWGKPFWEHSLTKGVLMLERAIHSHIVTSHFAIPLMIARKQGIVFEITDGDSQDYRGNLYYDLAKISVIRLTFGMAEELRQHNIVSLAVTPGFLRSEAVLDHFGITEENWRTVDQPEWVRLGGRRSETPRYIGRALVALATDPKVMEKSGKTFATWNLVEEYGFTDMDGSRPRWSLNGLENDS